MASITSVVERFRYEILQPYNWSPRPVMGEVGIDFLVVVITFLFLVEVLLVLLFSG